MWYTPSEFRMIIIKCNEEIDEVIDNVLDEQEENNIYTINDVKDDEEFEKNLAYKFRGYEHLLDDNKLRLHRNYVIKETLKEQNSTKKNDKSNNNNNFESNKEEEENSYKTIIHEATMRALVRANIDYNIVQEYHEQDVELEKAKRANDFAVQQQKQKKRERRQSRRNWLLGGGSNHSSRSSRTIGNNEEDVANGGSIDKPKRSWSAPSLFSLGKSRSTSGRAGKKAPPKKMASL